MRAVPVLRRVFRGLMSGVGASRQMPQFGLQVSARSIESESDEWASFLPFDNRFNSQLPAWSIGLFPLCPDTHFIPLTSLSSTEDCVRVYAEAHSQEAADQLAADVGKEVQRILN